VFSALAHGPAGVLYGLSQARATFRINLAKGPVLLLALLPSTWVAGTVGAAWALAAVEAIVLPVWIVTLRRTLRQRDGTLAEENGLAASASSISTPMSGEP
jgi:hypothetical protein